MYVLKSDAVSNLAFDIVTIAFCDVFTANLPASLAASMPACNCWLTVDNSKSQKEKSEKKNFTEKNKDKLGEVRNLKKKKKKKEEERMQAIEFA